jgi:Icc-related predicted phosphoesterase
MRLVYTSDLHGNLDFYRNLLELAADQAADLVAVGGDLLPPGIKIDGAIEAQRRFIREELGPLLSAFRRDHPHIGVYLVPGNDDWTAALSEFKPLEAADVVQILHMRSRQIGPDLWLAGYACVPITPYSIKDHERRDDDKVPPYSLAMAYSSETGRPLRVTAATLMRRPSIADELAELAGQSDPKRTIYICHAPPYNTALDRLRGRSLGSRSLRNFIERYQPPLTLHGHIHEAPRASGTFFARLGTTLCVNPGRERERFGAVVLDTDDIAGTIWHTLYSQSRAVGA